MWKTPWQKLILRAEKLVCYPSSLINIRYLISDEMTFVASQVRKLVGSEHPLLKTAKSLIGDNHGVSQLRGLIVLLVSKSFNNHPSSSNAIQRSIAEIIEMSHGALSIHRGMVNVDNSPKNVMGDWRSDMKFGNKMATLSGDFLLASVSKALADLQNTDVVDMISAGIGDLIESAFFQLNIDDEENYKKYVYLSNGSLLSKCCKAAVLFHSIDNESIKKSDEEIAENWAIRWCELYNICENIALLAHRLSSQKFNSKIFYYKTTPSISPCFSSNLEMLHNRLCDTRILIRNVHNQFPYCNSQSKDILAEMTELLYQDAVVNVKFCRAI